MQLFETKRRPPSISLAALIDILFLLIIFFVVSSRIIGESGVKLVLPYDKSKNSVAVEMPMLEMSADSKLMLQGNPLTEKQLPDALRELKKNTCPRRTADEYRPQGAPWAGCESHEPGT